MGRRPNAPGVEFAVEDSEYADDTAVLFPTRAGLEEGTPLLRQHFQRFGAEIHVGKGKSKSKSECLFVSKPLKMYENPETFDNANLR